MPQESAEKLTNVLSASFWVGVGLVFAIVVLVWVAFRVRAWYREDDDPAENARQMLSELQELYQEGDLSEEEFRSIKSRLARQAGGLTTDRT